MTTATGSILSLALCLMIPVGIAILLAILVIVIRSLGKRTPPVADTRPPQARPPEQSVGNGSPPADLPYTRRRYLLTQAERDFFAVLRAATPPGWYVFPQVRLANLVLLKKGTRNWKPHFSRVAQKCVDFVLCDGEEISPRLVVELDDASHDRPDRQDRDAFVDAALRSAGLPILHVRWQRHYDPAELTIAIQRAAGLLVRPALPAPPVAGLPVQTPLQAAPRVPLPPAMVDQTMAAAVATRWSCRQCGATVSATAKYCTGCGAQLEL